MAKRVVRPGQAGCVVAPQQRLVPSAKLIGEVALEIFLKEFGPTDWINQAVDAVTFAANRAVQQLSGSQVTQNAKPLAGGAPYVMPARTKEELLASQHEVADYREVPREVKMEELADPSIESKEPPPVVRGKWLL